MACRLVPVNFFDVEHAADLAVSPAAVTTMPETELQSNASDGVWRSTSLDPQVFTWSFGGNARQVSFLGVWPQGDRSSLIGAQLQWKLWSDVAKTTLVYNPGPVDFFTPTGENYNEFLWGIQSYGVANDDRTARRAPHALWIPPVAVSAGELTITNAGAVDTPYFESRRVWVGDYVQAPYNARPGAAPAWRSNSEHQRSPGGTLRRLRRVSWREMRFEVVIRTEADRAAWFDLCYASDPGTEIVLSLFQEGTKRDRDFLVMGSLEVLNPMVFENRDLHILQLAIVES